VVTEHRDSESHSARTDAGRIDTLSALRAPSPARERVGVRAMKPLRLNDVGGAVEGRSDSEPDHLIALTLALSLTGEGGYER
jgi:hypothetical protein